MWAPASRDAGSGNVPGYIGQTTGSSNWRKTCAVAVNHRLDDMTDDRLHNKKKRERPEQHDQSGSTATANARGNAAAITAPM
jgi:hypothetical protein